MRSLAILRLPGAAGSSARPPSGSDSSGGSEVQEKDVPFPDPGSEIVVWDGKNWNSNNNRLFEARFEKFLNEPEATTGNDRDYNRLLAQIMDKLAPNKITPKSTDEAFHLLSQASQFDMDAHLCDAIANQVYSAWLAERSNDRLTAANQSLEKERQRLEWNSRMSSKPGQLREKNKEGETTMPADQAEHVRQLTVRQAEVNALLKANQFKREVAEFQVKIEFQVLIVQHFMQRRFQHVVIGTQFYRSIFGDGDSLLRVGGDSKSLFSKATGMPPTVGTLDSLANEAMRDVREGVKAFQFLLEKNELESATKRLAETFVLGEYMPEIQTLPRDDNKLNQVRADLTTKASDFVRALRQAEEQEKKTSSARRWPGI